MYFDLHNLITYGKHCVILSGDLLLRVVQKYILHDNYYHSLYNVRSKKEGASSVAQRQRHEIRGK